MVAYFIGDAKMKAQGYESSDTVINNYLEGIDNNDASKIRNCFSLYSLNNNELYDLNVKTANELASRISIDKNSIQITSKAYSTEDIINNLRNPYITNANIVDVSFNMSEKNNYLDCTQLVYYKFITYEFDNEWYIYASQKIKEITDAARHIKSGQEITLIENSEIDLSDVKRVGSSEIGYLLIGNAWTETEQSQTDGLNNVKAYSNTDGSAVITMATTSADSTATVSDSVIDKLLAEHSDITINDIFRSTAEFCGYDAIQIFYLSKSDDHTMTWIFKTNDSSNKIYIISYDYSVTQTDYANYVYTFTEKA